MCLYLSTPIHSPATRSDPQSTLARDWPAAGCVRTDGWHRADAVVAAIPGWLRGVGSYLVAAIPQEVRGSS
jgi:hypothetical protein